MVKASMPNSFATELESESFDDLAGHHAASLASVLNALKQDLLSKVAEKREKLGNNDEGMSRCTIRQGAARELETRPSRGSNDGAD